MELFPPIPFAEWRDTKETLHRFAQIVGKIRLAASVRRNHWWNVPFHLTGRGITTRPMGQVDGNPLFTIDFDFVGHRLVVATLDGRTVSFPLVGRSVASFYAGGHGALAALGVRVELAIPRPFDLPDAARPFAEDTEHAAYDAGARQPLLAGPQPGGARCWRSSPRAIRGRSARCTTSGTPSTSPTPGSPTGTSTSPAEVDPVTREAYSREVISFGFWFGDDSFTEPAFYSYTAPEPAGLAEEPLQPAAARWAARGGQPLGGPAVRRGPRRGRSPCRRARLLRERVPGRRPARRMGRRTARLPRRGDGPVPAVPSVTTRRAGCSQMTGGRPSRVIRHTVRQRIGRRRPHGVRTPSAKPAAQARMPAAERLRTAVRTAHTPR